MRVGIAQSPLRRCAIHITVASGVRVVDVDRVVRARRYDSPIPKNLRGMWLLPPPIVGIRTPGPDSAPVPAKEPENANPSKGKDQYV